MNAEIEMRWNVRTRGVEIELDEPLDDPHGCIVFFKVMVERDFGRATVGFNDRNR